MNYTLATVAGDGAGTRNSASIFVKLHPIEARERDQFAVMAQVRDEMWHRSRPRACGRASAEEEVAEAEAGRACSSCCGGQSFAGCRNTASGCSKGEDHPGRRRCGHNAQRRKT